MSFSYKEIIDCLFLNHEAYLTLQQLKRALSEKKLGRRRFSSFDEVVDADHVYCRYCRRNVDRVSAEYRSIFR